MRRCVPAAVALLWLVTPLAAAGLGTDGRGDLVMTGNASGRYIGSSECATCHKDQSSQLDTPMAHALASASDARVLREKTKLTFRDGPFTYRVTRQGGRSIYSVTDGVHTISEPILYAFGEGVLGQTYLLKRGTRYVESRLSYFRRLDALDVTIGQRRETPTSLDDAVGRPLGGDEVRSCFGCHAPATIDDATVKLDHLSEGIGCEGCHGPGEAHAAAARAKLPGDPRIFNPGRLPANELTQQFCGSCHLGFDQAMSLPGQGGLVNVRFQAYRLFNSKGHRGADGRIACTACHDPHKSLERDERRYDVACSSCHSAAAGASIDGRPATICPKGADRCVSCHMPKVELEGMHGAFTDHWIRVVKPGEPTPN